MNTTQSYRLFLFLGWLGMMLLYSQPAQALSLTVENTGNGSVSNTAGITCGDQCTASYAENTVVALTATPGDVNTNFTGWSGDCHGSSKTTYLIMTENKICRAKFAQIPLQVFEITVVTTDYGKVSSDLGDINCGVLCSAYYDKDTQVQLTAKPDDKAEFVGWEGACVGGATTTLLMDESKTCVAKFKLKPLPLKVTLAGQGAVTSSLPGIDCGITCTASYEVGQEVTLTAEPIGEFAFSGWGGDCTGKSPQIAVTMDAAKSCIATFDLMLNLYKRGDGLVTSTPSGIDCGAQCQSPFMLNQEITLTAVAENGYGFTKWEGDCNGSTPEIKVTLDKTKQCTAIFDLYLTVEKTGNGTVTSDYAGINCGNSCKAPYPVDTGLTLTAEADTGYQFVGWEGDCQGTESDAQVTINTSRHCQANFAVVLSVEKKGSGDGVVLSEPVGLDCGSQCSAPFDLGAKVALSATPDGDSEFTTWSGKCEGLTTSTSVTVEEAKTCDANFALLPPEGEQNLTVIVKGGDGTVTSQPAGLDCTDSCTLAYPENSGVLLTATPAKTSKFTGWTGDCSGSKETIAATVLTHSTVCLANFELLPPSYQLTVETKNGNGTITSNPVGADCGNSDKNCFGFAENTTVNLTLTPAPDSVFLGWSGHCSGTAVTTNLLIDKENKKCTAHLELKPTLNLSLTKTGNGTVSSQPVGMDCQEASCITPFYQGAVISLSAVPDHDSKFGSWGGDCVGTGSIATVTLDTAKTCTVVFQPKPTYPLTVEKIGTGAGLVTSDIAGLNCGKDCEEAYYEGLAIVLTAAPQADSLFKGWSGAGCVSTLETATPATITMTAATKCTATFDLLPPLTLTVTKNGTGSGSIAAPAGMSTGIACGDKCAEDYKVSSLVSLTAKPALDSIFTGWRGDCKGTNTTVEVLMTDTPKACSANFYLLPAAGQHNLTLTETVNGKVTSTPAAIDCESVCTASYPHNTVVTLTATAAADLTFTNWTGDCDGIDPLLGLAVNSDKTCSAYFHPLPAAGSYLFTVIKQGGQGSIHGSVLTPPAPETATPETATPAVTATAPVIPPPPVIECGDTCTATYTAGTQLTLTATPAPGFIFAGWHCTPRAGFSIPAPPGGENLPLPVTVTDNLVCIAYFDPTPSALQFAIPAYLVNQFTGEAVVLVTRATSNAGVVTVDYTTQDGSAIAGTDYQTSAGTLTWLNGDTSHKIIKVPLFTGVANTGVAETTFNLLLANPTGKATITNGKATVTIIDAPPTGAGTLQLAANNYFIDEDSRQVIIGVERLGGSVGAVSVNYATTDDTATASSDYTATQGELTWANGDTRTKFFTVAVTVDNTVELAETFLVTLSNPLGGANLGAERQAIIKLVDNLNTLNVTEQAGILQFTQSIFSVAEGTPATLIVKRAYGSRGEVTVNYATQPDTALAGSDYTPPPDGQLVWAEGEITDKNIIVPTLPDTATEGEETVRVNLSNPTGAASLGAVSSAVVKILDSLGTPSTTGPGANSAGIIQLVADNYQVAENGGSITVTVSRTEGTLGVVEVSYLTKDNTAKTSRDYLGTSGSWRWLDGEATVKKLEIGILDNGLPETDKMFTVQLYNPSSNVSLGSVTEALVTIVDDDTTTLQFSSSTYTVNEDGKTLEVSVTREGGNIGQISVGYTTTEMKATAGHDYTTTQGLLTWVSGDRQAKKITIPILDDKAREGNENFQVMLTTITGNATFGEPQPTTVTIVDDDSGDCTPYSATTHSSTLTTSDSSRLVIDCFYQNSGILEDVKITQAGTVSGGQLSGEILAEGVIQEVTLLPKTKVLGGLERGIIRGTISSSDPTQRGVLTEVDISPNTVLSNIIIGKRTKLDNSVVLNEGVCFEDNSSIPSVMDLVGILGLIKTPYLKLDAMRLTSDVLCLPAIGGIVGAINGLSELKDWPLSQNAATGYLELEVENLHYAVLPTQIRQILQQQLETATAQGLFIQPDGNMTFVTHTSREIQAAPVVQDPLALEKALTGFNLRPMIMQTNGNLKVPLANGAYYSARPDVFSLQVTEDTALGLDGAESAWLPNVGVVFLVFDALDNRSNPPRTIRRKQWFYPTAADPEALYEVGTDSQTILELGGRVFLHLGTGEQKRRYQGVLDFLVTPGSRTDEVQVRLIEDVNGDDITDYQIVYPNGDRQLMYRLP